MMPNDSLFVQVLAQIEREPETWNQSDWRKKADCGTAYCFAGWACQLGGAKWRGMHPWDCMTDLDVAPIAAAHLLGLHIESWMDVSLFAATNTLNDLYRLSAEILGLDETVLRDKVAAEVQA